MFRKRLNDASSPRTSRCPYNRLLIPAFFTLLAKSNREATKIDVAAHICAATKSLARAPCSTPPIGLRNDQFPLHPDDTHVLGTYGPIELRSQARNGSRHKTLKRSVDNAKQTSEDVVSSDGFYGEPSVCHDSHTKCNWHDDVEGTNPVCQKRNNDPTFTGHTYPIPFMIIMTIAEDEYGKLINTLWHRKSADNIHINYRSDIRFSQCVSLRSHIDERQYKAGQIQEGDDSHSPRKTEFRERALPTEFPVVATPTAKALSLVKIPSNCNIDPTRNVDLKNPASSSRPEKAPMKKVSQTWTEPIQEIFGRIQTNLRIPTYKKRRTRPLPLASTLFYHRLASPVIQLSVCCKSGGWHELAMPTFCAFPSFQCRSFWCFGRIAIETSKRLWSCLSRSLTVAVLTNFAFVIFEARRTHSFESSKRCMERVIDSVRRGVIGLGVSEAKRSFSMNGVRRQGMLVMKVSWAERYFSATYALMSVNVFHVDRTNAKVDARYNRPIYRCRGRFGNSFIVGKSSICHLDIIGVKASRLRKVTMWKKSKTRSGHD
ncbi:hypothetical protein KC321_g71 [Hortaea werneckii]|nr:hypothetical protein KC321_g71 [Hortaea werneckii]